MRMDRIGMGVMAQLLLEAEGCFGGSEGSPALKLFSALGISLAAVMLIFYLVVKTTEKK